MFDTENTMETAINSHNVKELETETEYSASYDFGIDPYKYNKTVYIEEEGSKFKTMAFNMTDTIFQGVAGVSEEESEQTNYWTIQFSTDNTTGELNLDYAQITEYTAGSMAGEYYYVRNHIRGNMNTHEFFVQIQVSAYTYGDINIVGKGISQGDSDDYYVVYIDNDYGEHDTNVPDIEGYYRIKASATEADFKAIDDLADASEAYTNPADISDDPNGYGAEIKAYLDAGKMYDGNIVKSDFSNGGLLNIEQ